MNGSGDVRESGNGEEEEEVARRRSIRTLLLCIVFLSGLGGICGVLQGVCSEYRGVDYGFESAQCS